MCQYKKGETASAVSPLKIVRSEDIIARKLISQCRVGAEKALAFETPTGKRRQMIFNQGTHYPSQRREGGRCLDFKLFLVGGSGLKFYPHAPDYSFRHVAVGGSFANSIGSAPTLHDFIEF